jgi:hypothetical protein
VPRSPVRSHVDPPWSTRASAVAASSRQYPAMVVGERSQTSPTPSSGSWTCTSMPPRGLPTVNSASSSSASKAVPVPQPPDSVEEYRMEYAAPSRARASRTRAGGEAAPPMMIVWTHDRSHRSRSSRSSRAICGATPPMNGMRCSAMQASASAARQRPSTCVVVPSRRYHGSFVMKPTWANWVPASIGVAGAAGSPQTSPTSMAVTAASWRSRNSAPFGRPVVPDVKTSATGRSGSAARASTGRWLAPAAASSSSCPSSERTRAGPAVRATASCSGGARRGLTPAVTAPTLAAAA